MFNEALHGFAVRSFIVLLVAATIAFLLRHQSASRRHHVWTMGLLGCLLVPVLSVSAPSWNLPIYTGENELIRITASSKAAQGSSDEAALSAAVSQAKATKISDHQRPTKLMVSAAGTSRLDSAVDPPGLSINPPIDREEPDLASQADASTGPTLDAATLSLLVNSYGWIWLTVASFLGIRFVLRWVRVRRMLSNCQPITDDRLNNVFCAVCSEMSIARRPTLLSAPETVSPMVAGTIRPVVMMPEDALDWTDTQLQMVFTHELGHVFRHDLLIQSLGDLACAINWFNPLAWFAAAKMRSLREIACDDLVVTRYQQPANYADVLLKIVKDCRQPSPALTVSMARPNSVSQRLLSVVDGDSSRAVMNRGAARMSIAVSMVLIGLLSSVQLTANAQPPSAAEQEPNAGTSEEESEKPEVVKTMRVRIVGEDGNPLTNASLFVNIYDIERSGDFPNVTLSTDDRGEVDVKLPQKLGLLRLWPSKPGYVPQFLNFGNANQDEIEDLPGSMTFYLERGVPLGGTVVDSVGQPISGASVQVRVDSPGSRLLYESEPTVNTWLASGKNAAVTDEDGRWEIFNAPAKKDGEDYSFRLQVTHPEFAGDTRWGELQAKQGVTTEQLRAGTAQIKLAPGLRIRGKITGPDGKPVTQGLVIWDDRPYWAEGDNEALIDDSGNFQSLPLSPGQYPVTVLAPGFAPQQVNFNLDPSAANLDFSLKVGNPLKIEVVDQDGQPVPDVYVGIGEWRGTEAIYNNKHSNVPESGVPRKSDSNGIYQWDWAPEDAVVYRLGKKGFVTTEVALVARDQAHRITLSPQMKIYGTVTDKNTGEPIEEFSVVPVKAFRPEFYSTSFQDRIQAKDGRYEIPIQTHGQTGNRCMVRIEAEGYRTAFSNKSMEAGDNPLEENFELEPAEAMEAEVENPDGTRAFDFMVAVGTPTSAPQFRIERPDSSFGIAMKVSGSNRFELPATFEPQLVRIFNEQGFAEIDLPVNETLGTVRLQPWAKVTGRLMQGDKPIANEGVSFRPLAKRGLTEARFQDSFYTRTDHEGYFEFDQLPPMPGRIQAHLGPWEDSPMSSSQSIALNLRPGDTTKLVLGNEGNRVVGKVIATGRDNDRLSKQWSINFLISREPGASLPEGLKTLSIANDAAVDPSILQSDDFSTWLGTKLHYFVKLSDNGTLQVDGVPPGQYDLVIQLYEQPAGCLVETIGQKIIPVAIETEESTKDLANIEVECRVGPRVGSDMRAFKFIDVESRERNLNDMGGRYVLLHVWASWCAPCIASMPNLKSSIASHDGRPLTVIGLNVDDVAGQSKAKSLAEDGQWDWAMNYLGSDSDMMKQLAVSSVPAYYLVGPDGKLVMSSNQWTEVATALEAEFAE